jgi:hypothetical protein
LWCRVGYRSLKTDMSATATVLICKPSHGTLVYDLQLPMAARSRERRAITKLRAIPWALRMMILIKSENAAQLEFVIEQDLKRAFNALHAAGIRVLGGDRLMDGSAYIILAREADTRRAVAIVQAAGIKTLEEKPGRASKLFSLHRNTTAGDYGSGAVNGSPSHLAKLR